MKILVIVDVQKEFDKFIQHDLVDELYDYARRFKEVYQIWDTHKNDVAPTYVFPNQVDAVKKKYGKNHFSDKVRKFIKDKTGETFEGNLFKLSDNEGYIVRVDNNHDWFYVNPEIVQLIEKLKNHQVILTGGADNECLEDVFQAFKAFGLNVHINKKYVYSAKTDRNDSVDDNVIKESYDLTDMRNSKYFKEYNTLVFGIDGNDNKNDIVSFVNQLDTMFETNFGSGRIDEITLRSKREPHYIRITRDEHGDFEMGYSKLNSLPRNTSRLGFTYKKVFSFNEISNRLDVILRTLDIVPSYLPRKSERTLEKINIPNDLTKEKVIENVKNFKTDYLLIKVDGNHQKQCLLDILNELNEKLNGLFIIPDKFTNKKDNETSQCYWVIPLKDEMKYKFLTLYSASYNVVVSGNLNRVFGSSKLTITDMNYGDKIELLFSQIIGVRLESYLMYAPKNSTKKIDNRYDKVFKKDI